MLSNRFYVWRFIVDLEPHELAITRNWLDEHGYEYDTDYYYHEPRNGSEWYTECILYVFSKDYDSHDDLLIFNY